MDIEEEVKKLRFYASQLEPMVKDTVHFINTAIQQNKTVVVEGANAAMLDIDFGESVEAFSKNSCCGSNLIKL